MGNGDHRSQGVKVSLFFNKVKLADLFLQVTITGNNALSYLSLSLKNRTGLKCDGFFCFYFIIKYTPVVLSFSPQIVWCIGNSTNAAELG